MSGPPRPSCSMWDWKNEDYPKAPLRKEHLVAMERPAGSARRCGSSEGCRSKPNKGLARKTILAPARCSVAENMRAARRLTETCHGLRVHTRFTVEAFKVISREASANVSQGGVHE